MAEFTLYLGNKNYSSWSVRAWLAARLAGIECEEVTIPLAQADTAARIKSISPAGRVPTLRHGDLLVWDSLAIAEYLADLFPERGLWPEAAEVRAHARSVVAEMHAGFASLRAALAMNVRREQPPPALDRAAETDLGRMMRLLGECRMRHGGSGPWLMGTRSIADAYFAPVISRFLSYRILLPGALASYVETVRTWPAVQDWFAAARAEPWVVPQWER